MRLLKYPTFRTEGDLENLFSQSGRVKDVSIITDRYTGQAKGFYLVEMENDGVAEAAINALNGTQLGRRTLTVNAAKPREDRPRGGGYCGGGGRDGGGDGGFGCGGDRW